MFIIFGVFFDDEAPVDIVISKILGFIHNVPEHIVVETLLLGSSPTVICV